MIVSSVRDDEPIATMSPVTSAVVSVLGSYVDGSVFGARTGNAQPNVLILHGWRKSHADMTRIASGFDAISLDLPGFGASPQPPSLWGAREYATAIAPVLDELTRPLVVVGHSFGGRVAVGLAAEYPERIDGLVLTGVPLIRTRSRRRTPFAFRLAKFANRVGLIGDERMESERRKRGSADYRAAEGLMRDVLVKVVNESYEDELKRLTCRVELVWGSRDTEAPVGQVRTAATLIDRSNTTIVDGTHWLPVEHPEPVRDAIRRLIWN